MQPILKKIKPIFPFLLTLFLGSGLLLFPEQIKRTLYESILYSLKILIPTLFPFIALSSYAVHSGGADFAGKILGAMTKYVFRLPRICTSTLLLGLIGGYPSGAAGISLLLKQKKITAKQAEQMLLFCINPGVAFVISFVGAGLLQNGKTGLLLFISISISSLILGILIGFFHKIPQNEPDDTSLKTDNSNAIIACANDASKAMLKMCSAILLFSACYSLLRGFGIAGFFSSFIAHGLHLSQSHSSALLAMLFEIASGVEKAVISQSPSLLFAFSLAFAGFCVHFQIFSFFDVFPMSKIKFILFRFLHGFLSAFLFSRLQRFFPQTQTVFYSTGHSIQSGGLNMSVTAGFFMLLMCIAFLLLSSKRQLREKD